MLDYYVDGAMHACGHDLYSDVRRRSQAAVGAGREGAQGQTVHTTVDRADTASGPHTRITATTATTSCRGRQLRPGARRCLSR